MAFEFKQSRSFNPAEIQVNRGNQLGRASQTAAQSGFALSESTRRFVDQQTALTKDYEQKRAKKLAAGAEIVFEDVTYTGADGIERTRKLATGYKTPEKLLSTSWAAVTFDEEVVKVYTDAAINTANSILNQEKEIMQQNSTFTQSPAETTAMFDANIQEPLDQLRSTIPNEMRAIFENKVKQNVEQTRAVIANRQFEKVKQYNTARFNKIATDFESQFGSLWAGDPEEGLKLLEELKTEAEQKELKQVAGAHIWINSLYPAYKNMFDAGKEAQRFLDIDYSSSDSLAVAHSNLKNLELLLNFQNQSIPLLNNDGKIETVTLKSLGLDGKDNQIARNKVMTTLAKQRGLLKDLFTTSKKQDKVNDYIRNTRALQSGGQDYSVDPNSLKAEGDYLFAASEFDKPGSDIHKQLVPEYMNEYPNVTPTIDADNILMSDQANNYKQWAAGKYHIIGGAAHREIVSFAKSITNKSNEEIIALKEQIVDSIGKQSFLNATGAVYKTPQGKTIYNSIINKLPQISDDEEKEIANLVHAINMTNTREEAADLYIRNRITAPRVNNDFFKGTYGEEIGVITNKINDVVKSEYSEVNFGADNMMAYNFLSDVNKQVKLNLASTTMKKDIEAETIRVMERLIAKSGYGYSEYAYGFATATDDPDEIDFDTGKVFTKWSTDEFFNTHPSRLPEDYEVPPGTSGMQNPYELAAIYDENYLLHLEEYGQTGSLRRQELMKTPLYYEIQNELKEAVEINNTANPQFQIEEELVLGKNVKLITVGRPTNENAVVYQYLYLPNKEGERPRPILDRLGNNKTISRRELQDRIGDSNTNIDKHVKPNLNFGKIFELSTDLGLQILSPGYKGKFNPITGERN